MRALEVRVRVQGKLATLDEISSSDPNIIRETGWMSNFFKLYFEIPNFDILFSEQLNFFGHLNYAKTRPSYFETMIAHRVLELILIDG
jgi:hypothetical protein